MTAAFVRLPAFRASTNLLNLLPLAPIPLADAFDNDLMRATLKNIVEGKTVEVPTYDFVTHSRYGAVRFGSGRSCSAQHSTAPCRSRRMPDTTVVYPADVVLFEGILVFYNQDIRDMFHLRLFVDTDSDVRLSRRGTIRRPSFCCRFLSVRPRDRTRGFFDLPVPVLRDMKRGRDLEQILTQYTTFVKPAFEEFCLPVPSVHPH